MFYDSYLKFCEEEGVAPTSLLTELGISKGALSGWKSGSEPSNRTKKQIADFFGVTVSQLVAGKTDAKKPVTDDDELNEYLDQLRNRSEMRMLFKLAKGATKEEVEQAVKIIEVLRK